ncbi:unnamed protein product [Mytilus coruscus]|uniref:Uncharacterized protein n=1 Tax=Mytilus coruscus TaxID=42192 RepID=A0A6J8B3S8_MYTCO|nr:unnamed protein product [Mytilus coruscus]
MFNGSLVYTLNCSSDLAFELCTVEFLADNKTDDYVSYIREDKCIHLGGNCDQTKCDCSMDCKSFVWILPVHLDVANRTFGCRSRIEEEGISYIAEITVKSDGNNFTVCNNTMVTKEFESNLLDSVYVPTVVDISNQPSMEIEWKILIVASLVTLFGIIVILVVRTIIKCKSDTTNFTNTKDKVDIDKSKMSQKSQNISTIS